MSRGLNVGDYCRVLFASPPHVGRPPPTSGRMTTCRFLRIRGCGLCFGCFRACWYFWRVPCLLVFVSALVVCMYAAHLHLAGGEETRFILWLPARGTRHGTPRQNRGVHQENHGVHALGPSCWRFQVCSSFCMYSVFFTSHRV